MIRQSSITVRYKELVELSTATVVDATSRYNGAKSRGTTNLEPLAHQVEVARTLERMLKKGLREGKQTDMLALFEAVKP